MAVTWNPSDKSSLLTLSNSNLTSTHSGGTGSASVRVTESKSSGKWYWEIHIDTSGNYVREGFGTSAEALDGTIGNDSESYGYRKDGYAWYNNSSCGPYGAFTDGDIVGIALDLDNGKVWWAINNTWQNSGDPANGTNAIFTDVSGTYFAMHHDYYANVAVTARFLYSDQTYPPPSGFRSLDPMPINLFNGKVRIKDATTKLVDGKAFIGVFDTGILDGKTLIKDASINSFNGKANIKDYSIEALNGKARIKDNTTNILDGKVHPVISSINTFDGKAILFPIIIGNLTFPSFNIETITGLGAFLDESFLTFNVEAFTGGIADLTFPFFNVETIVKGGEVLSANLTLPSFALEALTGINGLATFPFLECNGNTLVGNLVNSNIGLPLIKLNADALVNIIARAEASFSELQIDAEGLSGILATGNSNLYPLHLISNSKVGPLASATISLSCLIVEGNLAHQITGIVNITFPMISLFAKASTLTKDCEILSYKRWR